MLKKYILNNYTQNGTFLHILKLQYLVLHFYADHAKILGGKLNVEKNLCMQHAEKNLKRDVYHIE